MASPKIVLYNSKYGNAAIVTLFPGFTVDQLRERMPGVDVFEFDRADLPMADQDFEVAWKIDPSGPRVVIDLDIAKNFTKTRLRRERKPLLEALDIAFHKAFETGQSTAEIFAEKQRLRDITTLVDACTTTAELRALKCAQ